MIYSFEELSHFHQLDSLLLLIPFAGQFLLALVPLGLLTRALQVQTLIFDIGYPWVDKYYFVLLFGNNWFSAKRCTLTIG